MRHAPTNILTTQTCQPIPGKAFRMDRSVCHYSFRIRVYIVSASYALKIKNILNLSHSSSYAENEAVRNGGLVNRAFVELTKHHTYFLFRSLVAPL